jgi:uncharacterized protein (TIGR03435 family)
MTRLTLQIALAAATTVAALAQTHRSFEVASIKPGDAADARSGIHIRPGGRFNAENATLRALLSFAYDLNNYQILGGPNWTDSAAFTIAARPPNETPAERNTDARIKLMIQSLLAERFKVSAHSETRLEPVYELVIAKGGHKLRPAVANANDSGLTVRQGALTGKNVPLSQLARSLSLQLGLTVIDQTELSGRYDFDLTYTPEARDGIFGHLLPAETGAADPSNAALFTALAEQLGLKLDSAKGPVEVLVIDHAERPTED